MTPVAGGGRARVALAALTLAVGLVSTGPAAGDPDPDVARGSDPVAIPAASAVPALAVQVVARGLSRPWDVQELPTGELLVTGRAGELSLVAGGVVRRVAFPTRSVWVAGETGLMGLAVDPDFAANRRVYACHGGFRRDGTTDVRVVAYTLSADLARATSAGVLVSGLPATTGRHGGCRLIVTTDGSLLVGTGDSATSGVPRDLGSLGGKTLRLDRLTGEPWPTNPWAGRGGRRAYVQTYGHRNVQGVAERDDGTLWSIEQGTGVDDEVNLLVDGGDYGWNPGPGYDERVPMTDQSLPGEQVEARWSSGPTPAASGGSFVRGPQWGGLEGSLAVACLQGEQVRFLGFDPAGTLVSETIPAELTRYGRMRTVTRAADGALLVVSDAGGRAGRVLRVTPRR